MISSKCRGFCCNCATNRRGGADRRPPIARHMLKDGYQEGSTLRVQGGRQNSNSCLLQGDSGYEGEPNCPYEREVMEIVLKSP